MKIVAHSPCTKAKRLQKGSDEIEAVIVEVMSDCDFAYRCITDLPFQKCMEEKARAHIFIDKLMTVDRTCQRLRFGLGKSGLEAMALGCMTLCAMYNTQITDEYYSRPPVVNVAEPHDLNTELRRLLELDFDELVEMGAKGKQWIAQHWGLENGTWLQYYERLCDDGS